MSVRTSIKVAFWGCAVLALVTAVPGCSGCRNPLIQRSDELRELDEDSEKEEEDKPKPDVEILSAATVPGEGDAVARPPRAKAGHWTSVVHEIRANNFDINAELRTSSTDPYGVIYPVENTRFELTSSRPAPLPKGQLKVFETAYYIPKLSAQSGKSIFLNRELRAIRGGGLIGPPDPIAIIPMRPYQYFFVVLASEPDRYGYLKVMTSIETPTAHDITYDKLVYYRVLLPQIDRIVPLPTHSLTWSSIAYLLWDDLDANMFTADQQTALLDWLHWGGQIIVSGPNSLAKLQGSFLDSYLPAKGVEAVQIEQAAIDELNASWSIPKEDGKDPRALEVSEATPLIGVRLSNHADANSVPNTAGLVTERRVGRGRIVVTSFSLTDQAILRWKSFDSFFNACLLRRPRRLFESTNMISNTVWADYRSVSPTDTRLISGVRYFSRDIGNNRFSTNTLTARPDPTDPRSNQQRLARSPRSFRQPPVAPPASPFEAASKLSAGYLQGFPPAGGHGVAAWNDGSGAANAARRALRDAAGISVPSGEFVLQVLAVYLLVLAPLNWGIFRIIGRVEWAWLAAPLIAVIGAFAVIRFAQLDIGFARSLTEVAIAEVQPGYSRAHVTRYTALYTSLSTSYQVSFEDPDSLIQPFGAAIDDQSRLRDGVLSVNLRRDRELRLRGFQVGSNKTGIVHCEQYCDLGGGFRLLDGPSGEKLVNDSTWTLRDVGILRRAEDESLEAAWIGDLASKATIPLEFIHLADGVPRLEQWNLSTATLSLSSQIEQILSGLKDEDNPGDRSLTRAEVAKDSELSSDFDHFDRNRDGRWDTDELNAWCRDSRAGEVSLGQVIDLASRDLSLRAGDARLIGWSDEPLPARTIAPTAAQITARTLFVVHLKFGRLPDPLPDANCWSDVDEFGIEDLMDVDRDETEEFFPR